MNCLLNANSYDKINTEPNHSHSLESMLRLEKKYTIIDHKKQEHNMNEIIRTEIDETWAHSAVVQAGDNVYISYCMKNEGKSIEDQINGAFDVLSDRLKTINLTLDSVVQMDCLFKDIHDLPYMEKIIKQRFNGKYPARKAFETKFLRDGISFQIDAIAYKK